MAQRQSSEQRKGVTSNGHPGMGSVTGRVRSRGPRLAAAAVAAWALAACVPLPVLSGGRAPMPYAQLAAVGPAASFGARVASNSLSRSPLYAPNIAIGDSTLAATIVRMRAESPAFDSAMTALVRSGIPTVIGTARQLPGQIPPGYRYVGGWQALTAFYPLTPTNAPGRRIEHIAVIVRLTELQAALRTGGTTGADTAMINLYLERVIAHEIYGHLMPQLELGRTAPIACDDPTSSAQWYTACVMRRERRVVAQLSQARGGFGVADTH